MRLRPMTEADAAPYVAAFRDDPGLGRLLGLEHDPELETVRQRIAGQAEQAAGGRSVSLAIADAGSDAFCGQMLVHSLDWENRHCEVGFWVLPSRRRGGVAVRALTRVIDWAFGELDMLRIEMTTTPENEAIPALAAKLGFQHEGILRKRNVERGLRVDIIWFGLLREEWAHA